MLLKGQGRLRKGSSSEVKPKCVNAGGETGAEEELEGSGGRGGPLAYLEQGCRICHTVTLSQAVWL